MENLIKGLILCINNVWSYEKSYYSRHIIETNLGQNDFFQLKFV